MQEIRRFKPSTVSRRFSVATGFYRTCVIDGLLKHSPAEHVRRPTVPAESPTLGFTHLQFEALLTAARQSPNPCDFALVAMLGLLGLRIFEATSANIADLGEDHGHRVLRVCGKGAKVVLVPLPPAVGRAIDRSIGTRTSGPILLNSRGARMDRHAATRRLRCLAEAAGVPITRPHPHMLRHILSALFPCGIGACENADLRTGTVCPPSPRCCSLRRLRQALTSFEHRRSWRASKRHTAATPAPLGPPSFVENRHTNTTAHGECGQKPRLRDHIGLPARRHPRQQGAAPQIPGLPAPGREQVHKHEDRP